MVTTSTCRIQKKNEIPGLPISEASERVRASNPTISKMMAKPSTYLGLLSIACNVQCQSRELMPLAIQDWQSQSQRCDYLVMRASKPSTKESRVRIHIRASSYQNFTPLARRIKQGTHRDVTRRLWREASLPFGLVTSQWRLILMIMGG
jgi:hypothetical protein